MSQVSQIQPASFGIQAPGAPTRSLEGRRAVFTGDRVMVGFARLGAVTLLAMLVLLLAVLMYAAWPSIRTFGLQFLYTSHWRANEIPARDAAGHIITRGGETVMAPPEFGALPSIYGTALSSLLAIVFAVPLSFGAALFLVRLSPGWVSAPVSFLIEFLAAIPSIAYGMWGLFVLAPFLQHVVEPALDRGLSWIPGVNAWLFSQAASSADGQPIVHALPLTGRDMFCGGLV